MSGYQVALFFHLLALLSAIGASTIEHVSMVKVRDAASGEAALPWMSLGHSFARVFPVALAVLVGTGAWMVHDDWSWSSPFVLAGLAGVVFLFVSGGAIAGGRAGKVAAALAAAPHEPVPDLVRDRAWWCASWADTGVAIGVVLAMTTRPGAAGAALCVAGGLSVGIGIGLGSRRRAKLVAVVLSVVAAALVATAQARAGVSSQLSVWAEDAHGVSANVDTTDTGANGRSSLVYNWPMANVPQDCSGDACGFARGGGAASTDEAAGVLRAITGAELIVENPTTSGAGADADVRAASTITDGITLSKPATVWLEGTVHGTVESTVSDANQLAGPNGDLNVQIDLCCQRGGEMPVPFGGYERDFVADLNAGPEPVADTFSIPIDLPAGWTMFSAAVTAQESLLVDGVPNMFLNEGALLEGDTVTFHVRVPDDVVATSDSGLLPIVGGAAASDGMPPVSTATLADAPNAAGWNTGPTSVHIAATDDGSGVASITYTLDGATTSVDGDAVDLPVTAEGTTELTYFATDAAGNAEAAHSLAVKIDGMPPAVTYAGNAGTYGVDDDVSIACTATDALSGVASTTCADATAPAYAFGLGTTTLSASATDVAGNTGTGSTSFTVTVDGGGLARLTVDLVHGSAAYAALDPRRAAVVDRFAAIAVRAAERRFDVHAYDAAVRLLVRGGWLTAAQGTLLQQLAASV